MSLTQKINVVFMGTPDFAVPSLQALCEHGWEVKAVFTQPDRPKGRKKILTPPPVKVEAQKLNIPVFQPEKLRSEEGIEAVRQLSPDLIVTAAYGQILPKAILDMPRFGCINVHASLLPKYRGGAPIHHAIINGETKTGITIMYMAEGLDTGDMIVKRELAIESDDTVGTMFDKLKIAGAELLIETLPNIVEGKVTAEKQNEAEATYAPNITKEDERIRWDDTSVEVFNRVRGLNPMPGAYTTWDGDRLKVWSCLDPLKSERSSSKTQEVPGTVLTVSKEGVEVATGDGSIWITELQPSGKKAMNVEQFVQGTTMKPGTVLGAGE